MNSLANSISSLCQHIIQKPMNMQTSYSDDFMNVLENFEAWNPQYKEVVRSQINWYLYLNLENKIRIKIFKDLSIELNFNDVDNSILKVLDKEKQYIKNWSWYHVAMQKGDIEIKFPDTSLSQKISEDTLSQKTGVIIKGDNCFVERVSPGWRDGEKYALMSATQNDLKAILSELNKLV